MPATGKKMSQGTKIHVTTTKQMAERLVSACSMQQARAVIAPSWGSYMLHISVHTARHRHGAAKAGSEFRLPAGHAPSNRGNVVHSFGMTGDGTEHARL